jgi:glycosyl transferase, family 25
MKNASASIDLHKNLKVLLINLDRSPDRLENVTLNLNTYNISFDRVAAVDGRQLTSQQLVHLASHEKIKDKGWITPQVIGCSLSHYEAYRRIIESSCEWGLILEDDIEFTIDPRKLINESITRINTTDIFLLYFHGQRKIFSESGKIHVDAIRFFYPALTLEGGYSTGAYLLHREVAKKLYDYVFPVHISADSYYEFYKAGVIDGLWALLPPITKPCNIGSDITYSTIGKFLRQLELSGVPIANSLPRLLRRFLKTTKAEYEIVPTVPAWLSEKLSMKLK